MRRTHLVLAALAVVAAVTLGACSTSGSAASSKFCVMWRHYSKDKTLTGHPSSDAGKTKQMQAFSSAFDRLTAVAPAAIKPDMQTTQHFFNDVANALSTPTLQDRATKAQAVEAEQAGADAAAKKVDSWAKSNCRTGFSFGS